MKLFLTVLGASILFLLTVVFFGFVLPMMVSAKSTLVISLATLLILVMVSAAISFGIIKLKGKK